MSAWDNQLGALRLRSVALPRDGGVLNPATAGKYALHSTNVAKTIKREHARLKAEAAAKAGPPQATAAPATPCAAPVLQVASSNTVVQALRVRP